MKDSIFPRKKVYRAYVKFHMLRDEYALFLRMMKRDESWMTQKLEMDELDKSLLNYVDALLSSASLSAII